MDCVCLDVDTCGDMNATTMHGIIAMTAVMASDLKNAKTEVESIQQWKASLLLDKIEHGTKTGEILDPLKVEKSRLGELDLMNEHNMKKTLMHAVVPTYTQSGCNTTRVLRSDADWQQRSWPTVRGGDCVTEC